MLYVMVGYPGSGKTTQARKLAITRICIDDLWQMMWEEYRPETCHLLCEYEDLIVHDLIAREHDVVIDRCNMSVAERRHWVRIAQRQGSEATVIFMSTPWDECLRRVEERPDTNLTREIMKEYRERLEFPNEQEGFVEVVIGGK